MVNLVYSCVIFSSFLNCLMGASECEFAVCDVIVCGKSFISVLHCVRGYKLVQSPSVPMGVRLRASFTEQTLLVLACYAEPRAECMGGCSERGYNFRTTRMASQVETLKMMMIHCAGVGE